MGADIRLGVFDPGDAAGHVRAHFHGLMHQLVRPGLTRQPVLRERTDLELDHALEFFPRPDEGLHRLQPGFAVHVGKSADVRIAM